VLALEVACFSVFILWVLKTGASGEKLFAGVRPYIPLLLFVLICLLQLIPLPGFILGALSGKSLEVWETTEKALSSLGAAAGNGFHTISIYPDATLRKTLLLLAYAAFGVAVSRSFRSDGWIKLALAPVFAMLFLEASLGIYQYLGSGGGEDATGTYFNRNHYAGFLEMALPLALGYVLSLGDWSAGSRRPLLKRLLSSENFQRQMLFLFLLGIAFLAVFFSRSRMGIFSVLASLVFFTVLSSRGVRSGRGVRRMIYVVVAVALFLGLFIGLYPVLDRFLYVGENLPSRTEVWKDSWSMVRDFPLFGTGLGTFAYSYPLYKMSAAKPLIYLHAHNDYLEILTETGFPGLASLLAALAIFLYSSLRSMSSLGREESYFRFFILLGALTGVFSMLVHSLADFGLQIPSNALYFSFLVGLCAGAGSRGETGLRDSARYNRDSHD
jgi:O-antigen ligase